MICPTSAFMSAPPLNAIGTTQTRTAPAGRSRNVALPSRSAVNAHAPPSWRPSSPINARPKIAVPGFVVETWNGILAPVIGDAVRGPLDCERALALRDAIVSSEIVTPVEA